jgi:hypothetical protein
MASLASVTNWCAFFIALTNVPSLYLAGGFVCLVLMISAVPTELKDPGMTAIMEGALSKIAAGELTLTNIW